MTIYIKPMTWAGNLVFFVGHQPSQPDADPCRRLGSYFLKTTVESHAYAVAEAEARRIGGKVWRCPHFVGL